MLQKYVIFDPGQIIEPIVGNKEVPMTPYAHSIWEISGADDENFGLQSCS